MQTKKTLITKFFTDVTGLSERLIDLQKAIIRAYSGDNQRVEFEVITEDPDADNATAERLLRLVRSEFETNDEQSQAVEDMPVIRIESNGTILSFDAGKEDDAEQDRPEDK
jgi:hypothetical protein